MKYELSFIISPAIPETEHKAVQEEILGYLVEIKAKVIREPYFIGRKKLAYPIQKQKHGFYVFLEFEIEEKVGLKELDTKLKHNNSLLRYLIIKLDRAAVEAKLDPSKFEEAPAAPAPRSRPARRAPFTRPLKKESPKPIKASVSEQKADGKPKIKLDDIDKKLDDILKDPKID
ncbi:30S ribosomal protein S6 [bacterium]|nr:30S ribosomal protein S6 [bacterium]